MAQRGAARRREEAQRSGAYNRERIVSQVPLWAQRSKREIVEARHSCITFALSVQESKSNSDTSVSHQNEHAIVPCQKIDTPAALQLHSDSCMVSQIVEFALRSCVSVRTAATFFFLLKESAQGGDQVFTVKDVEDAEIRCMAILGGPRPFNHRKSAESSGDEGSNSEDELSGEEAVDREEMHATAELLADLGVELTAEEMADDGYPVEAWQIKDPHLLPGCAGFNARADAALRHAQLCGLVGTALGPRRVISNNAMCPPLQPHQEIVGFFMHPKSPMKKLLVDHPTGSGKTREMIRILDNFFYDPRPKIPIFPKAVVCRNFYMELLRWPNRYRDYFCCERPQDATTACGSASWQDRRRQMWDLNRLPEPLVRQLCRSCREVLEMKGQSFRGLMRRSFRISFHKRHPGEPMPLAPLRALSYASAGGSFSALLGGYPVSAVMKIGFSGFVSSNVYSNKIVLMDEAHNLLRSQTRYVQQLQRLRDLLPGAAELVLVGFTGTPILGEREEGDQLLNLIKGGNAGTSEEGFLSSLATRPRILFPQSLPHGIPDGILTPQRQSKLVHKIELHEDILSAYDRKRERGIPGPRLRTYCNVCSYASSFHDGRSGNKAAILARPNACCPKLVAVVEAIASSTEKAVVLTARSSGYRVIVELLRQISERSSPRFSVATVEELSSFNHVSNIRGEVHRVLVADAAQCSEGISFLAVRRAFLTDVPQFHSQFVQMCGRSIRMYGHRGLPEEEQCVMTQLYVASFPQWMSSPLACWAFRAQKRCGTGKGAESSGRALFQKLQKKGVRSLAELRAKFLAMGTDGNTLQTDEIQQFCGDPCQPPADTTERKPPLPKSDSLMRAANRLCFAASADDASLALSSSTADEDALEELARQSQELAGALAIMRSWAVDKNVLDRLDTECDSNFTSCSSLGGNDCSSIVVHSMLGPVDASAIKPSRRLRGKTGIEALGQFNFPASQDNGNVASMLPLCDAPAIHGSTDLGTHPERTVSRGTSQGKRVMQTITKKKNAVGTKNLGVEAASITHKRVRRK